nr:immunoglobulin heavy chain junction region [Macaca mulatta]MOX66621.1 immunoglobulin heavy chain junction region [Macaca mulatta]MOX66985.1 immunoglobulin heavy chain junction region [Macaca mulatta]
CARGDTGFPPNYFDYW